MKAVILNGMEAGDAVTASVQRVLVETLQKRAWDVEPFILHDIDVRPCGGCFGCWLQTPGRCVMGDADDVARSMVQSDLLVYLTPVTFGGYSSQLKKVIDHTIFLILPFFQKVNGETHHVPRYDHRANLLVVGVLPEPDAESEEIFTSLAERNAVNMSAPRWAAGVITRKQSAGSMRDAVQGLLAGLEVAQ